MKIFIAIKSSAQRSLKSWKGLLIVWFLLLLLASLLAIPMKGALKSGFGDSMITEKLVDGFNIEAFTDLGASLRGLISYFRSGFIMAVLAGFLLNAFLTGGLFYSLKGSSVESSVGGFFRASAKNFWTFLIISLIISLIILIMGLLIIALPIAMVGKAEASSGIAVIKTGIIVISIFFLLLTILLLVADYARAWQVIQERNRPFKAIGFGFSQTFSTFLSSYPLMIILLIVQLLFFWLVLGILPGMKPVTGVGVFLLFLLSQFLFLIKILLKVWRYGSVTSLMEQNNEKTVGG
ncbi:MAG: hypothetical protein Q7J06_05700 [Bacteroidales bacterium]|nr:hypothetical protein [Bacteroidales bacterium]